MLLRPWPNRFQARLGLGVHGGLVAEHVLIVEPLVNLPTAAAGLAPTPARLSPTFTGCVPPVTANPIVALAFRRSAPPCHCPSDSMRKTPRRESVAVLLRSRLRLAEGK